MGRACSGRGRLERVEVRRSLSIGCSGVWVFGLCVPGQSSRLSCSHGTTDIARFLFVFVVENFRSSRVSTKGFNFNSFNRSTDGVFERAGPRAPSSPSPYLLCLGVTL